MAPHGTRRSGHSRRAQYTTFFGYVIAVVGALVGVVVLFVSHTDAGTFGPLRSAASDAVAPAGTVAAGARAETQDWTAFIGGFFVSGAENSRLRREIAVARVKLAEAAAIKEENARLKALLKIEEEADPRPIATARLIGSTSSSARRFAILGAGTSQGVKVGMPVRSPLGLVGRILETGSITSRVLLITDSESVVPVRRASDGLPAFASGRADGTIQLRLINLGINPLKLGDAFVTSGAGGLYRPNIAFAVVTKLLSDGAIAHPIADPGTTEFVAVDPVWTEPAKAADLPPAPDATSGSRKR